MTWIPSSITFTELNDYLADGKWGKAEEVARKIYNHYYNVLSFPPDTLTEKQNNGLQPATKAFHDLLKAIKDKKVPADDIIEMSLAAYKQLKSADLLLV